MDKYTTYPLHFKIMRKSKIVFIIMMALIVLFDVCLIVTMLVDKFYNMNKIIIFGISMIFLLGIMVYENDRGE